MDSNPIHNSPTAVAYSSCSNSPMMDFPELQANANMAVNQMLSIKRSSDFNWQWAIWDFEALLKQWEAEEAAAKERARIVHSRSDLSIKVKCAKVVMKVKYEYWVVVQEARATQCSELEESEAAYLEAICKNAAAKSLKCMVDHSDHTKLMHELERWALDMENNSCHYFLLAHQTALSHAPQSHQRRSTFLLPDPIGAIIIIMAVYSACQGTPNRWATTCNHFPQARTEMVSTTKKVAFID